MLEDPDQRARMAGVPMANRFYFGGVVGDSLGWIAPSAARFRALSGAPMIGPPYIVWRDLVLITDYSALCRALQCH